MSKKNKTEDIEVELAEDNLTTEEATTEKDPEESELSAEEKLMAELAEQKDKYIRLYSEFENFRRRTAKEKVDIVMNASENLIKELLPVVDDFERAQQAFEKSTDLNALKEGLELVFHKLRKTLESKGLKPMESKDSDFDTELHECITQFAAGDDKKGKVIDEVEKGYYLNDKVIRYAKVVVGS
jgi:molecular chaperone GrpE